MPHLSFCCRLLAAPAMMLAAPLSPMAGPNAPMTAQQFVASFQRGDAFHPDHSVSALVADPAAVRKALAVLAPALATLPEDGRAEVVDLLLAMGSALAGARPGHYVLRERVVIEVLLVQGQAKADRAAASARQFLLDYAEPASLQTFSARFTGSLKAGDPAYLRLAAKAKSLAAKPHVERLSQDPEWRDDEVVQADIHIALAALGNTALEDALVEKIASAQKNVPPARPTRFYDNRGVKDASDLLDLVKVLGPIGTPRMLRVACGYLRSPLQARPGTHQEHSIRRAALEALRYNYPGQQVLGVPRDAAGWHAAEQFCTRELGVAYQGPTPELSTDRPLPMLR